jgi:aminocarboxymuconate-semialdehyde decarboxylase
MNGQEASKKVTVVDVHSHLYPSFYFDLLKTRTEAPYVKDNKFINRASAAGAGKPITPMLYDVSTKIKFMDLHNIDVSILSIGNPWLDFLDTDGAGDIARDVNDKFDDLCSGVPERLYFFACLPLSAPTDVILSEISRVKKLQFCRGVVMGCNGLGEGLDDERLIPVYQALADNELPVFLHPNYGLPGNVWGKRAAEYGQILQISMGFPLETTIALTRLFLSGVFHKVPTLRLIASHAAGTLPFLAGRVENAIDHDRSWHNQGKADPGRESLWDVLKKNVYLDGIVYDKIPLRMAVEAAGEDRVLFGTDHPFFPPIDGGDTVPSMWTNEGAVRNAFGDDGDVYKKVMGRNAIHLLSVAGNCGCH